MTTLVPDAAAPALDRPASIARKKFSCSTFMLYLGIEGDAAGAGAPHDLSGRATTGATSPRSRRGAWPPGEPSFYVQNACVTDPALAPPGHSTLYVLVPVGQPSRRAAWTGRRSRRATARSTLKRLERIGIRDIERRIRFEKILTPQGWEEDLADLPRRHVQPGA